MASWAWKKAHWCCLHPKVVNGQNIRKPATLWIKVWCHSHPVVIHDKNFCSTEVWYFTYILLLVWVDVITWDSITYILLEMSFFCMIKNEITYILLIVESISWNQRLVFHSLPIGHVMGFFYRTNLLSLTSYKSWNEMDEMRDCSIAHFLLNLYLWPVREHF